MCMTLPFFIAFAYYILLHWDLNGLAWTDWREAGNYGLLDPYGEERSSPLLRQLLQWSPAGTPRAGSES